MRSYKPYEGTAATMTVQARHETKAALKEIKAATGETYAEIINRAVMAYYAKINSTAQKNSEGNDFL
jgi:hypothetical protein